MGDYVRKTRDRVRDPAVVGWIMPLCLCIITLLVAGCSEQKAEYPQRQMPAGLMEDAAQLYLGQQLFMRKCASCHGKPSEGRSDRATFFQPPASDFSERHYREVDPAYLYWRIEVGKQAEPYRSQGSVMPAWGAHFSEEQIWQLVAYLKQRAE